MDQPSHGVGGVGYLEYGNLKLPSRSRPNLNAAFIVKRDHRISFDENQWPSEVSLPGFRQAVERFSGLVQKLAMKLLPIYAVALDLPTDFFTDAFEKPFFRLRMSHYRGVPQKGTDSAEDSFGIHPHVDTSFMTLLLTDGEPGLCIYSHIRNEWIEMPALSQPTAVIVNSGELLRQWSNDRCLSTRHFVRIPERDRYSVPFFFCPNSDFRMECLPSCCNSENHPPKYPPFSYNESQGVVQGE